MHRHDSALRWRALVAFFALTAVAAGATGVAGAAQLLGSARGAATPSLFVSPTGNDAGRCTRAAPCQSWNRAYQLAQPGQTVELAAGTYPGQELLPRAALRGKSCSVGDTSTCVTFVPAAGAIVAVDGSLVVQGAGVYVKGTANPASGLPTRSRTFNISVSGYASVEAASTNDWPDHVVMEGIDTGNFVVGGADDVLMRNLDVGPSLLDWGGRCTRIENRIGLNGASPHEAHNVVLDGLFVHNQNRTQAAAVNDCHYGGLLFISGSAVTLRNSVFSQNVVYNIQIQNFVGSPASNVTIQNNWFGCPVQSTYESGGNGANICNDQVDLQFSAASNFANWLIRYNSFAGGIGQYSPGETYSNIRIVGNAGGGPSANMCQPGITFAYNAWLGGRICTQQDVALTKDPFRSSAPGTEDFSLLPGTKASGLVPGTGDEYSLTTDIVGRMRPLRAARDAGATQRETAELVLLHSIGVASLGAKRSAIVEFYGPPRRSRMRRLGPAHARVRVDLYRLHGGTLRITYADDVVVGLGTDTAYYTTTTGFGPGSLAKGATALHGAGWDECRKGFVKRVGQTAMYFVTGPKKETVRDVSMLRRSYDDPCTKKHR